MKNLPFPQWLPQWLDQGHPEHSISTRRSTRRAFLWLWSAILLLLTACGASSSLRRESPTPRAGITLDAGWRFHLGDSPGAEEAAFDDSAWRLLDLPHDWSIEGKIDLENPSGWRGGFFPAGVGWYRKTLTWDPSWKGKKVRVEFDGVYMLSKVWINGRLLGERPNGYIGFSYDLTPYLRPGKNVLVVRADNSKVPNGRWYTGCGIYRHVRLVVTGPIHLEGRELFVSTKTLSLDEALLSILAGARNETSAPRSLTLVHVVRDPMGRMVRTWRSALEIPAGGVASASTPAAVRTPLPWSPESPRLYTLETSLVSKGQVLDRLETSFGIRTVRVDPAKGFFLNGVNQKLRGVSLHHDGGPVGSAVPEDVWRHRLTLLKEMGCNAVRTAHNPAAPEFYDLCDRIGLMVMDEAFDGWDRPKARFDYGLYFKEWWRKDLEAFVRRDRNHPSVVIWSIGNEVPRYTLEMQKKLVEVVKSLDPTRPVTQGRGERPGVLDIVGFNGGAEHKGVLEKFHEKHPEVTVIGTEITHTLQTRGIYRTRTWYMARDFPAPWVGRKSKKIPRRTFPLPDLAREEVFPGIDPAYLSSYDNAVIRMSVRREWSRTRRFPFFMGSFRWTGIDYLGEAISKRGRASDFGVIDLAGFPKDHYSLYQSFWTEEPMVHLLPHWTHPGEEGQAIPVVVYTNCEWAELFLNGESLGRKKMGLALQLVWKVPYQPGQLEVHAGRGERMLASGRRVTAGKPAALRLHVDKTVLHAGSREVARLEIQVTDAQGNPHPSAARVVRFQVRGPARLIAVDNGDILDLSSTKTAVRRTFSGKCMGLLQVGKSSGPVVVEVSSPGLRPARARLPSR